MNQEPQTPINQQIINKSIKKKKIRKIKKNISNKILQSCKNLQEVIGIDDKTNLGEILDKYLKNSKFK